eukprot:8863434-Alexandrium_andersonii.AAC.1
MARPAHRGVPRAAPRSARTGCGGGNGLSGSYVASAVASTLGSRGRCALGEASACLDQHSRFPAFAAGGGFVCGVAEVAALASPILPARL